MIRLKCKLKGFSVIPVIIIAIFALSSCNSRSSGTPVTPEPGVSNTPVISKAEPKPEASSSIEEPEIISDTGKPTGYIETVVDETIAKFAFPGMGEYDKAKAAFDYIIANTTLDDPVGLDLWRVRGNNDPVPGFIENRSLSVLLFGVGMCEDYAAALTALLNGMGLEAKYVPGLTYAADGSGFVDHAWTVTKIDGVWYHLDCQLEQNITRRGVIRYKYFMRGDATMSGSHRWGQNLIDSRLLTGTQNNEITAEFLYEPCPADYPTPPPNTIEQVPKVDRTAQQALADSEIAEYEKQFGQLPAFKLNIIPPVFGDTGYPPGA